MTIEATSRERPICEICGRSSPAGSSTCVRCGVAFASPASTQSSVEDRVALGADQSPCMLVTLGEFLARGRLGEVALGMTKAEVLEAAGLPAEFHDGRTLEEAAIWINGRTTFWFEGDRLARIGVYFLLTYLSNPAIRYDPAFPAHAVPIDELRTFMRRAGMEVRQDDGHLITPGGVALAFDSKGLVHSLVTPPVRPRRGHGTTYREKVMR